MARTNYSKKKQVKDIRNIVYMVVMRFAIAEIASETFTKFSSPAIVKRLHKIPIFQVSGKYITRASVSCTELNRECLENFWLNIDIGAVSITTRFMVKNQCSYDFQAITINLCRYD